MEDRYLGWAYGEDIVCAIREYLDEFWDSEVALIAVKMAECLDFLRWRKWFLKTVWSMDRSSLSRAKRRMG